MPVCKLKRSSNLSNPLIHSHYRGEYTVNKKMSQFLAICTIGGLSWVLVQNPWTDSYLAGIKREPAKLVSVNDRLYEEIQQASEKYNEKPADAVIDRVWKKTPGYNGIEIDVNKSYKRMKAKGIFNEKLLIFKETSPAVHLKDLPPSPIYRANPKKPSVSFIINVAWGNEYIGSMLDTLKKHHIKATFVLEGRWVKNNPEMAKTIAKEGHELGNHSYTHPDMKNLSMQASVKEIEETNKVIQEVTGVKPALFGPPSGSFNDTTVKAAASLGMETILWTVDTVDWRKPAPEELINRVVTKLHNGALVLMHPTDPTSKSLETLITSTEKNYKIMPVGEALSESRSKR